MICISATFTAEPIQPVLEFWARQLGEPWPIEFAPYNQVLQTVLDPTGPFAQNRDGANVLLVRPSDLAQFEGSTSADHDARLAELLEAPACMVTCGAASAISVGTAACLSQGDPAKLRQLPARDGIRYEVIQQRTHRSGYEHQMELCGAKIITVETRQELENAINERTGMLFFLNKAEPNGQVSAEDFVKIGKARGIPTMNDAASDATPKTNLSKYTKMGFDLVIFSGGKALRGPQASGLLLGRKDLIEAAQPAMSPYGGIGRGMKVGKEEMVGLLAAVERYLKADHTAEWKLLESRVASIRQALAGVKGVTTERHIPVIANELPHVTVHWDEAARGLSSQQVGDQLLASDPPIQVQRPGKGQLLISVWMMRGNEHEIVGRRLKEIFG